MKKPQSKQGQEPRICKLAVVSLLVSITGFIALRFVVTRHYPAYTHEVFAGIMGLLGLVGLILGVRALKRIAATQWKLRGVCFAVLGLVLGASLVSIALLEITVRRWRSRQKLWPPCASNLQAISRAIVTYRRDHDEYPDPNQWCDLLLKDGHVSAESFICPQVVIHWVFRVPKSLWYREILTLPFPEKGKCHFAMNPNCRADSALDTVLLFETKEGWNQAGGPQLASFEHHNGKGCHVLFRDRGIKFVRPGEIDELQW